MDHRPDHGIEMTTAEQVLTDIEGEEPYLLLGNTRGELNWSGTLRRHWQEFEKFAGAMRPAEGNASPDPVDDILVPRTETARDAALFRLPLPAKTRTRQFVSFHPIQELQAAQVCLILRSG